MKAMIHKHCKFSRNSCFVSGGDCILKVADRPEELIGGLPFPLGVEQAPAFSSEGEVHGFGESQGREQGERLGMTVVLEGQL